MSAFLWQGLFIAQIFVNGCGMVQSYGTLKVECRCQLILVLDTPLLPLERFGKSITESGLLDEIIGHSTKFESHLGDSKVVFMV